MSEPTTELGRVDHAVNPEYARALAAMNTSRKCTFCDTNRMKNQPIGPERSHWWVKHNDFPYPHQKLHLVLILKEHKETLAQITGEEFAELLPIMRWAEEEFKLPGGMLAMRFGAFDHSGATIAHLHCHIQVPDQTGPVVATVFLPDKLRDMLKRKEPIWQPWL